jgi:hypothetical protein
MKWVKNFAAVIVLFLLIFASCQREDFLTDPSLKLEFSVDTLRFDTVFTTLGSATRILKVYNPHSDAVSIEKISIQNTDSFFRMNIDGISSSERENIEILPNDSLYIFTEVTIDPDMPISMSPFVIEDYIEFEREGEVERVLLEAWGQNANYVPNRFSAGKINILSCSLTDSVIWDDPKPYVIYGILGIDSCHLVFPPGTDVFVHGGVAKDEEIIYSDGLIVVLENGSLVSRGSLEEPVTIQGDRLESDFEAIPGQWSGIRLLAGSTGNIFKHTIVKNSIVGVRVDSMADLQLQNSQILNTSNSGLIGVHANIVAENSLIAVNGGFGAALIYGGNYQFDYCTIANYGNQDDALRLDNFTCSDPLCSEGAFIFPLQARFRNCIIMGSSDDEISLADATQGMDPSSFQYTFDHCIVRVEELLDSQNFPNFFDNCNGCINANSMDTLFVNLAENDFHLDTMSIAERKGIPIFEIGFDLEGNLRDASQPDIGCFEFQE